MTEKEKFQKTFDKLHASPYVLGEVLDRTMSEKVVATKKKKYRNKAVAAVAAMVLAVGSGSVCYAMDLGGIQRIVQIWIHGDQTDAVFTVDNGTYSLDYKDSEGKNVHQGGGGVAFNEDGTERPLTEEELWDEVNAPNIEYKEDGSVILYYLNQELDITDKFEDGVCYLALQIAGETRYMTVKYQNGYTLSTHSYIQPWEFNSTMPE